jgi:hypothetical protein
MEIFSVICGCRYGGIGVSVGVSRVRAAARGDDTSACGHFCTEHEVLKHAWAADADQWLKSRCGGPRSDFWSGGGTLYSAGIRTRPTARCQFRCRGVKKSVSASTVLEHPSRKTAGLSRHVRAEKWSFDAKAGRQELLYRRIGANELDAIAICHGYVEAQHEYALQPQEGYDVNQYAQRIISTPGKQDGLAWKNPDGTWGGPIGEKIAQAIEQGYTSRSEPYHGYFFKILKGQGPAAPLGAMDFVERCNDRRLRAGSCTADTVSHVRT